jgi:hypothetical protein
MEANNYGEGHAGENSAPHLHGTWQDHVALHVGIWLDNHFCTLCGEYGSIHPSTHKCANCHVDEGHSILCQCDLCIALRSR